VGAGIILKKAFYGCAGGGGGGGGRRFPEKGKMKKRKYLRRGSSKRGISGIKVGIPGS